MNKENYKIISDINELSRFINWLPDLAEGERYYISLLARRKYFEQIPSNNQQLKRFLTTKELMFSKIKQLEIEVGGYTFDGKTIPNEALALYISVNPRSLWRGSCEALKKLADVVARGDKNVDPQKLVMNCVQSSAGKKNFVVFDIDDKNPDLLKKAFDIVGKQWYIETRGGYHLLVQPCKAQETNRNWYMKLKQFSDICGDEMSPICGGVQGSFCPVLKELSTTSS